MNSKNKNLSDRPWLNADNAKFYENFSIEDFKKLAAEGGLDTCCDLEKIRDYLENANSILEVGIGYGRVCEYLINSGLKGSLYAVERNEKFCQLLRERFGEKIHIFERDFLKLETSLKFDVILLMWMGEISKNELPIFLSKIYSLLSENGVSIIDLVVTEKTPPLDSTKALNDDYFLSVNNSKIYGYFFSKDEIKKIAKNIGFKKVTHQAYSTPTGRPRISHLLFKT